MDLTPEERAIARRKLEMASTVDSARSAAELRRADWERVKAEWGEYLAAQRSRDYPDSTIVKVCMEPRASSRAWKASGRVHTHRWYDRVAYNVFTDDPHYEQRDKSKILMIPEMRVVHIWDLDGFIGGFCPNARQNDHTKKNDPYWNQPTWTWETWGSSFSQYSGPLNRPNGPSPEGWTVASTT